jgi:glycosyltransferase involved in cell wall biosynthesis
MRAAASRLLPAPWTRTSRARRAHRIACAPSPPPRALSIAFIGWEWPEEHASAAGVRTVALARALRARGHRVAILACAAENPASEGLRAEGFAVRRAPANRGRETREALGKDAPDVVVFDRFLAEEAFGARVREDFPRAVRVLDMQDAHALRRKRMEAWKGGASAEEVVLATPDARDVDLQRELGSATRSDVTLACSRVELEWLATTCGLRRERLCEASFFHPRIAPGVIGANEVEVRDDFERRRGFSTVGTFKHLPNVDSVEFLAAQVWPLIRKELPEATMEVYGSYPNAKVERFHAPKQGFYIRGRAERLETPLRAARAMLAPLRFGAGIKGKVLDAWTHGLPVVTTPIGSEATVLGVNEFWTPEAAPVTPETGWGGFGDCTSARDVADAAVALHENFDTWHLAQANGARVMQELFMHDVNMPKVIDVIERSVETIDETRAVDFAGQSLWYHTDRSTLYFSKWVELKETGANT